MDIELDPQFPTDEPDELSRGPDRGCDDVDLGSYVLAIAGNRQTFRDSHSFTDIGGKQRRQPRCCVKGIGGPSLGHRNR